MTKATRKKGEENANEMKNMWKTVLNRTTSLSVYIHPHYVGPDMPPFRLCIELKLSPVEGGNVSRVKEKKRKNTQREKSLTTSFWHSA